MMLYVHYISTKNKKIKIYLKKKNKIGTSDQDGGIGRNTLPPHETTRRITTKLKTISRTARKLNCMEVQQPRI